MLMAVYLSESLEDTQCGEIIDCTDLKHTIEFLFWVSNISTLWIFTFDAMNNVKQTLQALLCKLYGVVKWSPHWLRIFACFWPLILLFVQHDVVANCSPGLHYLFVRLADSVFARVGCNDQHEFDIAKFCSASYFFWVQYVCDLCMWRSLTLCLHESAA